MLKYNHLALLALSAILFLWIQPLRAQTLIYAKVLTSEGPVEIRRAANGPAQVQPIAFKTNDELQAGDTIITGKKGRLVLGLSDGSQAVIAAQTTVVIQNLQQSPRTLFNVLRGKTRVQIEKRGGQPNPYRVNTPTAVIAVRGTIFDVLVKDDETEVFLHEGEVSVFNLALPNQPVLLVPGQTPRITGARAPRNPNTFKPGRNDDNFRSQQPREQRQDERRSTARNNPAPGAEREGGRPTTTGERDTRGIESDRSGRPVDFGRLGNSAPGGGGRPGGQAGGSGRRP